MAITAERFAQGLTYEEYRGQMTRNRDRFEENERAAAIGADDLAFFRALPEPLKVAVLAEDWCGDVIANLPVLGRLAEESGRLDVRVFLRDENLDIMDQYLKDGQFRSIPVFVLMDGQMRELGTWTERPARVTELQREGRRQLFATHPALAGLSSDAPAGELPEEARAALSAWSAEFRAEHRDMANAEVVRELRQIVGGGRQAAEAPAPAPAFGDLRRRAAGRTASQPAKVTITYCAACGYEPQTLELARTLMYEFLHDLASIELVPWEDGAFDVAVDGELVHSMYRDGGFPEPAAIVAAVRARLGQAAGA